MSEKEHKVSENNDLRKKISNFVDEIAIRLEFREGSITLEEQRKLMGMIDGFAIDHGMKEWEEGLKTGYVQGYDAGYKCAAFNYGGRP